MLYLEKSDLTGLEKMTPQIVSIHVWGRLRYSRLFPFLLSKFFPSS